MRWRDGDVVSLAPSAPAGYPGIGTTGTGNREPRRRRLGRRARQPGGIKGNTGPGGSVNSFHASNTIIASNTSDQGRPDCSGRVVDGAGGHNLLKPQVAA